MNENAKCFPMSTPVFFLAHTYMHISPTHGICQKSKVKSQKSNSQVRSVFEIAATKLKTSTAHPPTVVDLGTETSPGTEANQVFQIHFQERVCGSSRPSRNDPVLARQVGRLFSRSDLKGLDECVWISCEIQVQIQGNAQEDKASRMWFRVRKLGQCDKLAQPSFLTWSICHSLVFDHERPGLCSYQIHRIYRIAKSID